MSDTENTTPAQDEAQDAQETTGEETPRPETDWKAEARKWEHRAKENSAAAKRLAELEEQGKSELQKAQDRAAASETARAQAELALWRAEVALEKGLTPAQAARLIGSDRDELLADAEQLLKDLAPAAPAKPGLRITPHAPDQKAANRDAMARQVFGV